MKRQSFAVLAVGFAILATLLTATVASAHAPIKFIHWDSQTNPTSLTAATDNRMIETAPNSFYLRVYNAQGVRVDNGDASVSADQLSITVTLMSGLQAGPYRVDWKTTSTDGAVLTDSVALSLPGSVEPAVEPEESHDEAEGEAHGEGEESEKEEEAAGETIAPPSTGDGGLVVGGSGGLSTAGALGVAGLVTAGGIAFAYRRQS